jgi:dienelactone hydrolase
MKVATILLTLVLASGQHGSSPTPQPELVSFEGPNGELHGFLYKPSGDGPFPAILWNHGSEKLPGRQPDLADFFTSNGFVFFVPHRAGQGRSPGNYVMDQMASTRAALSADRLTVLVHEHANRDVVAASAWLMKQPFVDAKRVAMVGCSFGGIQTLLSAEKGLGFKAFVAFAPAAMSWSNVPLRERLKEAVSNAKAPVFILQAANDFSTEPTKVLAPEAVRNGGEARLYPAFGASAQNGHWAFATLRSGTSVWGNDVLGFLRRSLGPGSPR